jgi:hypothetical protein
MGAYFSNQQDSLHPSKEYLMTGPTDQFVEIAYRSRDAVTTAARTWNDAFRGYTSTLARGQFPLPSAHAAVDATFDLAAELWAQQHKFANALLDAGAGAYEALTPTGQLITKASDTVTGHAPEDANSEQAAQAAATSNETDKRGRAGRTA